MRRPLLVLLSLAIGPAAFAQEETERETEEEAEEVPVEEAPDEEVAPAEEEATAEDEVEELDPGRAAPAGKGVIWGTLKDDKGEPLIEAEIAVVGTDITTITDFDGNYRLELAPGTYNLRFWYEQHHPSQLQNIKVAVGELVRLDEKLKPEEGAVDVIEVETETESSSTEGQNLERKRAASVGDSVGRAEMSKQGDRSAADAARRVVGLTVEGSRFVFIRGLGERYTNALLDGAPLPSPEPDRQAVPFDLFPAQMLDGLNVVKTFTPDSPGDFAGGSVRITTRRIPRSFLFSVSLGAGFNSQSTFRQGLGYSGGDLDWLGVDDGTRALPDIIPDDKVQRGLRRSDGSIIGSQDLATYGRAFGDTMSTERSLIPVDHSGNIVVGQSFDLGGDKRLGVMGALSYGRRFEQRGDEVIRTFAQDGRGGLRVLNDLSVDRGIDRVGWGGLAGITLELGKHHSLHLTGLYSRNSDKEASEIEGRNEEKSARLHETRLSFVSRELLFGQLRGEHELPGLGDAEVDWNLSVSRAGRSEPDTRSSVYQLTTGTGYLFLDDSQSGMHFFSDQGETTFGGGMNWEQPLVEDPAPTSIKVGSLVSVRSREFDSRRFRFRPTANANPNSLVCAGDTWDPACPDRILAESNIGSLLELEENTRPNDAYDAELNVFAGYIMLDSHIVESVRLIVGERLEVSEQTIESIDPHNPNVGAIKAGYDSRDFLPAASLVWAVTSTANLRLGASRTLARPQLREVAPFSFTDYFGGREVQGNPDLSLTHIYNADLRFEWFPTLEEVLAASVFFKRFSDPIEEVIQSAGARGIVTFQNAESANLFGIELEARKSFDFIAAALDDLSLVSNVTFARSRVELDAEQVTIVTNTDRPLSRQAPYILNIALDYSNDDSGTRARISYNVAGARIVAVGTSGLPDIYEQPRHQLDLVASQELFDGFELKASARNLLNSQHRETQGSGDDDATITRSYRTGVTVGLGATYTY